MGNNNKMDLLTYGALLSKINKNEYKGKKWRLAGDSITWYDGHPFAWNQELCIGYPSIVKENLKIDTLTNDAISGASIAQSTSYPTSGSMCLFYTTGSETFLTTDFMTIFVGTNDFKLNVPLGNIGVIGDSYASFDVTTFYGAYRKLIECVLIRNKDVKLILMTPLQRNSSGYDVNTINTAGHKLIDYVNAVKKVGEMYAIPVLDLFSESRITALTLSKYLGDGLHPNNVGQARIAELLTAFLKAK